MPRLSPDEKKYIINVYPFKTDNEIARELKVSPYTIKSFRSEKKLSRKSNNIVSEDEMQLKQYKFELDKKRYFDMFRNSQQYRLLGQSYTEDEVSYYLEEFFLHLSEIESQGGTLEVAEKRALDQLIKTQIEINRFTGKEKLIEEETYNQTTTPARKSQLMKELEFISKELRELRNAFMRQQEKLELTKESRTKNKADVSINILTIANDLKNEKTKLAIGYWLALSEKSIKTILRRWREDGILEDSVPKRDYKRHTTQIDVEDN